VQDRRGIWYEAGLGGAIFILPSVLALASRGVAALAAFAGLCAAGLVLARPPYHFRPLRHPAALLLGLVAWGALSASWSLDAERSLILAARLLGMFAAGLALAAAAGELRRPERIVALLVAGCALGIVLAAGDLATEGGINRYFHTRPYRPTELNQIAVLLAIVVLPAGAALWSRARPAALAAASAGIAVVALFVDATAKIGLLAGLTVAALVYWRRGAAARVFAVLSILAIVTAPLTLPRLAHIPGLFDAADSFKESAGHRLLIWSFTGARIAERPVAGWGLDTARAIPGGAIEIRPGEAQLPLHPHDAALQVWLELGAAGAALFAVFVALLWRRLADAAWPRPYAAAAAGSLAAALTVALAAYGVWQEWWLGTLALAMFLVLVLGRTARTP